MSGLIIQRVMDAKSLSARRVWIEINAGDTLKRMWDESLSARRVWIEIFYGRG